MPRRRIDGMDVHVDDNDAPLVGVDIEDVLYEDQTDVGTVDCHTTEEYEQASRAYNSAQKLLLLLQSEGYVEQMRIVKENAQVHADAERRYTGVDEKKILGLRGNRVSADYVETFLTGLLEDAKGTPRPILVP
jgi:hypothetical protein